MNLLRIDSSARQKSISRQLTAAFVEFWKIEHPDGHLIERDLTASTISPITDEWTQASFADPGTLTSAQKQILAASDQFIEELHSADMIVIGAPMYNFTISAPLKAWIDQIVRPGRTIVYKPAGPQGLLVGKKALVLTSRGGTYASHSSRSGYDFQEPYLRILLGYIGLADVTFIHAENQQRRDQAEQARNQALIEIEEFLSPPLGEDRR